MTGRLLLKRKVACETPGNTTFEMAARQNLRMHVLQYANVLLIYKLKIKSSERSGPAFRLTTPWNGNKGPRRDRAQATCLTPALLSPPLILNT